MLRTTLASSRVLRVGVLGLVTFTTAMLIAGDSAEARRSRHRHATRHHTYVLDRERYSPQFSSIIVDGNSGAVLTSNSPDSLRHPASLTKIMTLYLLFERLEAGKMKLDTEMAVSAHASEQAPTKLGLRPGQTIKVEDAIKGLVTRSANDAAVVIAEAIGGDEDDFAEMMTRKARALGMSKTVYRNASGLPNDEQVTTARDQATLGRAIQDRFPRYYRYFSTSVFNYRGQSIRNHNHLLGSVEGVDGIKTGYTRASGFNLVSSMRRGNRHLVGVVLGGRSGGSRDAIMRNLLAENLDKAATTRTVAAITEKNVSDGNTDMAQAETVSRPSETVQANNAAASEPAMAAMAPAPRPAAKPSLMAQAAAALPPPPARGRAAGQARTRAVDLRRDPDPADISDPRFGRADEAGPGEDGAGQGRTDETRLRGTVAAGTARDQRDPGATRSGGDVQRRGGERRRRQDRCRQGDGPQRNAAAAGQFRYRQWHSRRVAGIERAGRLAPAGGGRDRLHATRRTSAAERRRQARCRGRAHSGWIIQVGALESESEARQRIDLARSQSRGLLNKADPFTEPVVARDNRKLFRARFAGLERDQAEAVCRTLKRADISCITVRN